MFDDRSTNPNETANPASVLLMNAITLPAEHAGTLHASDEGTLPDKSAAAGRSVEEFLSAHESVIQAVTAEKSYPALALEYDGQNGDDQLSPIRRASTLTWWQRIFAGTSVGLEINERAIRVATVRRWGNRQEVVTATEFPLNEGTGNDALAVAEHLKRLMSRLRCGSAPVTSILAGTDLTLRLLRIPKVSKKEIHDALLWKNKKELHFFNDAPTVLHYVILDEDQSSAGNEFHVLVIAVKEESIKRHLAILEKAQILPSKLIIRPVAQWNIVRTLPDARVNRCVVDVGHDSTHVTFYRNGTLRFAREIPVGGNHFTKALMQTIFVDQASYVLNWEEADAVKREVGMASGTSQGKTPQGIPYPEIGVMMRPVAEKLSSEIRMSMDYFTEQFKVESYDHVLATGNGIRMKGLKPFLESQIGQIMRPLRMAESVAALQDDPGPEMTDTIGAALSRRSDFSFLPQPNKTEWKYRRAMSKAIYGLFVLLMAIGTSAFMLSQRKLDVQMIHDHLVGSMAGLDEKRREFDELKTQHSAWQEAERVLLKETRADSTVVTILRCLSAITPKEIVINQISWGHQFNEMEMRRQESQTRMKDGGIPTSVPGDSSLLRIRGAVYLDVFFADVHLLNFINAFEKTTFGGDVTLKEKRRDTVEDVMYFEIVARGRRLP